MENLADLRGEEVRMGFDGRVGRVKDDCMGLNLSVSEDARPRGVWLREGWGPTFSWMKVFLDMSAVRAGGRFWNKILFDQSARRFTFVVRC